MMCFWEN